MFGNAVLIITTKGANIMPTHSLIPNQLHTGELTGRLSRTHIWIGRTLSALVVAFMLFDGGIKLVPLQIVTETMGQIGWPTNPEMARGLGMLGLLCAALYAFPRTSLIGAILLTGYLGGAIATQLRIGAPLFSHILFGVYLGLMAWGGLALRDNGIHARLMGK
jgi:TRAP-type C4-dicarboxylate transport system permease small subunit